MKATIKFEDGREAVIELTPAQVTAVESKKLIDKELFAITYDKSGAIAGSDFARDNPLHTFKSKSHAQFLADRFNLEMEMFRWASEMNEGWNIDFSSRTCWLLWKNPDGNIVCINSINSSKGIFGLAFKSKEKAEQAKDIFGDRILSLYGKQF